MFINNAQFPCWVNPRRVKALGTKRIYIPHNANQQHWRLFVIDVEAKVSDGTGYSSNIIVLKSSEFCSHVREHTVRLYPLKVRTSWRRYFDRACIVKCYRRQAAKKNYPHNSLYLPDFYLHRIVIFSVKHYFLLQLSFTYFLFLTPHTCRRCMAPLTHTD